MCMWFSLPVNKRHGVFTLYIGLLFTTVHLGDFSPDLCMKNNLIFTLQNHSVPQNCPHNSNCGGRVWLFPSMGFPRTMQE